MPPIRPELLDELLKDYKKPDDLLGQDGLLQQLTKALVERALDGELAHHLGYERHDPAGDNSGNSRNGTTPKTMRGKRGQVQIDVPRDRTSEFEPQLVKKGQTRFDGLDENIISLYARGMTQREIQGHLEEIYGVEVSPSLISTVTDAVLDEVRAWQSRPWQFLQQCPHFRLGKNHRAASPRPADEFSPAPNFPLTFYLSEDYRPVDILPKGETPVRSWRKNPAINRR